MIDRGNTQFQLLVLGVEFGPLEYRMVVFAIHVVADSCVLWKGIELTL